MRSSTVVGLLVLALVAGGVMWTRSHGQAPPAAATDPPDITHAEATATIGDLRVTLAVTPTPPVAFATNRYRVRVERRGGPVTLSDGRLSFEMAMPMGDHRYSLVATPDGAYEAVVVLPMCQSGTPRWLATIEGTASGVPVRARFRLDLAKPGSAASH
jgi:hypothetical protein